MGIRAEVVIVGAGPCGLFQIFELGLLGIKAHIVDSLSQIGGQCSALYPDKPIYDIPAILVCGAQELVHRLEEQIKPFDTRFHLRQEVVELKQNDDGGFHLKTSKGTEFDTQAVVVAGGVGSFRPRPLRLKSIEKYEGESLNYKVQNPEKYRGKDVVVLGGGDSALDWALELYEKASSVTLIHRREEFRAAAASVSKMKALSKVDGTKIRYVIAKVKGFAEKDGGLTGLEVESLEGVTHSIDLEDLLVFYGLSPNLGTTANWGLGIERKQIGVDTEKFQTNIPGIFAIGDINSYPGKKKPILSGLQEAALAAFAIQKRLYPDERQYLQYTTTSPIMHERLGVSGTLD